MAVHSSRKPSGPVGFILKIIFFATGGFLVFRYKNKVLSFVKNQNFIISAIYAVLIAFIALFYRLIVLLNWIIQQAR